MSEIPGNAPAPHGAVSAQGVIAAKQGDQQQLMVCDDSARCVHDGLSIVEDAAFSPDGGRLVATDRSELTVRALGGMLPARVSRRPAERLAIVGIAAGGGALAVEDRHRWIVVWDTRTGAKLLERKRPGFRGFSPDGGSVALIGAEYRRIEIHPLTGGSPEVFETGTDHISDVVWSPDGRRLAISSGDRIGV